MKIPTKLFLGVFNVLLVLFIPVSTFAVNDSGQEQTESNPTTQIEISNQKQIEEQKTSSNQKYEQIRQKSQDYLDKKKEQIKPKDVQQKQKICQNLSTEVSKKLVDRQNKALTHKTKLDGHLAKISTFVEKNNLQLNDYDQLLANAQKASSEAQAQIDNLLQYQSKIDCTNLDQAPQTINDYKEALIATKNSLKSYQNNIKDLLQSVKNQAKLQGALQ